MVDGRIGSIQPRRQADATGHGIKFRNTETVLRDQQIRPDDARDFVLECGLALKLDQAAWFPKVEPARDPFRLFALDALAIEQVDRAVKLEQDAAERFQFPG